MLLDLASVERNRKKLQKFENLEKKELFILNKKSFS